VSTVTAAQPVDRFFALEGAFNLRDLGGDRTADGRAVRLGRLWRADGPERLTDGDRALLETLEIATVIDLRADGEFAGSAWPTGAGGAMFHISVLERDPQLERVPVEDHAQLGVRYVDQLERALPRFVTVIETMAERIHRPVLFHCSAGKDRTGVVAALVLELLGVPDDAIVADYARSHEPHVRRMTRARTDPRSGDLDYDAFPDVYKGAHPEAMAAYLAELRRRHGGGPALLLDRGGLSAGAVARLRSELLT
jgi:protein-tyrosine phosphatase